MSEELEVLHDVTGKLKDIRNLFLTIKNLDMAYISDWVQRLQLREIYKEATDG